MGASLGMQSTASLFSVRQPDQGSCFAICARAGLSYHVIQCHPSSSWVVALEDASASPLAWERAVITNSGRYPAVPLGAGGRGCGEGRSSAELGRSDVLRANVQCPRRELSCLRRRVGAPPPRRCLTFTVAGRGATGPLCRLRAHGDCCRDCGVRLGSSNNIAHQAGRTGSTRYKQKRVRNVSKPKNQRPGSIRVRRPCKRLLPARKPGGSWPSLPAYCSHLTTAAGTKPLNMCGSAPPLRKPLCGGLSGGDLL